MVDIKAIKSEYYPELDFCKDCSFYGEPNGCNRPDGECASYDKFLEIYEELQNFKKAKNKENLINFPYLHHNVGTGYEFWQIIYIYYGTACVTKAIHDKDEALKEFERIKNLKE